MTDEKAARLRAVHDDNIGRYRRLLKTKLSDLERGFVERRLNEERLACAKLGQSPVSTCPPRLGRHASVNRRA
jgi:hypothetical protein